MREAVEPGIDRARESDLEALATLERLCFAEPWSREALATQLARRDSTCWVGRLGGSEIRGYTSFVAAAGEAELLRLAVDPAARRRGLGGRLLAAGLADLAAAAVAACWLEVRADNVAARALYERVGFQLAGTRPGYYRDGEPALLYRRQLALC